MTNYSVTGMSCASCSAKVEKAVSKVHGVKTVSVNLLTNSMTIEGNASSENIISAVEKAGYRAFLSADDLSSDYISSQEKLLEDKTTPKYLRRLIISSIFLLILMYFCMGHEFFNFPIPAYFIQNPNANGILQFILCSIILFINRHFFINGSKAFWHFTPNMDSLVSLGSGLSYLYSIAILIINIFFKDVILPENVLYFESSAMIVTLITIGKTLESFSKGKTTNALKALMKLSPETAVVIRDGNEEVIPLNQLKVNDIFIVKAGDKIPADGIVIEGESSVDESALTGESIPCDKSAGSSISSATVTLSGWLKCKAQKVGNDTTLSQIIKMVSEASNAKAPIAKIADKVSLYFIPVVILLAITTAAIWFCYDTNFAWALTRGISVLVISCPCALGLATPVAIMVGNGIGAKNGILFKSAECLEETGKAVTVILDKTGTLTEGKPVVTDIIPLVQGITETDLLQVAYDVENKSDHPLARAICEKAKELELKPRKVTGFKNTAGNGISCFENGDLLCAGNLIYTYANTKIPSEILSAAEKISHQGKTPLFFTKNRNCLGIIALADKLKDDAKEAVSQLYKMGMRIIMLTGDNKGTAQFAANEAGIKEVTAGVLPKGKEQAVLEIKHDGKTIMVGDGINDAPSLTCADIGMAIGTGTDVAIDAADIVLMNNSVTDVCAAIRLSQATMRIIKQNLFWAFFYNILLIPLAAGVLYKPFGITVNPVLSAAAMSLSSFCVVMNALRLNLINIRNTKHDKAASIEKKLKGEVNMAEINEKTIKIEGMKCEHCEASVKKAIESIHGIKDVFPDHNTGETLIKFTKDFPLEKIIKAVEKAGFKVISN